MSFIFSYLYELYWVILNVPEDANRNIYGALNSRKLQVLYVKYEKKQEPSNGLLKKDIVAPFLSRGKTPSTGVWCLEETEVFALFASSPRRFHPKINKNHPKQGRWISKVAASHFFNANKEVINAVEANSTPKSTIDANKFGETLFFEAEIPSVY